ncbi:hypothetical protein RAZWK3B_10907 [Roseobacter sp. AzwK-3b]|nr:hypothetical protein RAZWK3B_10907 [Roseobacter sp. AzwK-3b]
MDVPSVSMIQLWRLRLTQS